MVIQTGANGDPKKVGEHHSRVLLHGEYGPNRSGLFTGVRTSGSKISPIEFHQKHKQGSKSYILSDRQHKALSYLTKMGGVKSLEMIKLSKEIWDYLLSRGITITTAWRPDPFSQGTDAIHQDWFQDYLYAFPLFCILSRILRKVRQKRTPSMLLITPTWPT